MGIAQAGQRARAADQGACLYLYLSPPDHLPLGLDWIWTMYWHVALPGASSTAFHHCRAWRLVRHPTCVHSLADLRLCRLPASCAATHAPLQPQRHALRHRCQPPRRCSWQTMS